MFTNQNKLLLTFFEVTGSRLSGVSTTWFEFWVISLNWGLQISLKMRMLKNCLLGVFASYVLSQGMHKYPT